MGKLNGSLREQDQAKECGYTLRNNLAREIVAVEDGRPMNRGAWTSGYQAPMFKASIELCGLTPEQVQRLVDWVGK